MWQECKEREKRVRRCERVKFILIPLSVVCLLNWYLTIHLLAADHTAINVKFVKEESVQRLIANGSFKKNTSLEHLELSFDASKVAFQNPFTIWEAYKNPDWQKLTFKKSQLQSVRVSSPGVSKVTEIMFLNSNPGWLSARIFTADIFLCPRNGHEGSITHLFNQILNDRKVSEECISAGDECAVLDVGSNLGFYSLLPAKLGFRTYAFDLQPICLRGLNLMSEANNVQDRVFLYNLALADRQANVTSSGHSCDYENYLKGSEFLDESTLASMESKSKRRTSALHGQDAIHVSTVQTVLLDDVILSSSISFIPLLKIDTEGAEVLVLSGSKNILSRGIVKNLIVELTLSHWFRFGLQANSSVGIDVISSLTEKYNFEAYALFFPVARRPPLRMAHIVQPIHSHPLLPMVSNLGCKDESGNPALHWKILDMRSFLIEYCLNYLATVGGGENTGFCGNIWFHLMD